MFRVVFSVLLLLCAADVLANKEDSNTCSTVKVYNYGKYSLTVEYEDCHKNETTKQNIRGYYDYSGDWKPISIRNNVKLNLSVNNYKETYFVHDEKRVNCVFAEAAASYDSVVPPHVWCTPNKIDLGQVASLVRKCKD